MHEDKPKYETFRAWDFMYRIGNYALILSMPNLDPQWKELYTERIMQLTEELDEFNRSNPEQG